VPNNFIARAVIDPNNSNTAYVTLSAFGVANVWRTTNLNAGAPTWTAVVGSGANTLPQVPVNSFLVDPLIPNNLYTGTDIGVYASTDGGANWMPLGTGLPRIAVFGLEMAPGRIVRAATHGKGMYQIPALLAPTAASVSISGRVLTAGRRGIGNARVTLTDSFGNSRIAVTTSFGYYNFAEVAAGETYVIGVAARRYVFSQPTRIISVNENISALDFTAENQRAAGSKFERVIE